MNDPIDDDRPLRLTPKGFIMAQLIKHKVPGDCALGEEIWDGLARFVAKQAAHDGHPDGLPCLIMRGGGVCLTAREVESRG